VLTKRFRLLLYILIFLGKNSACFCEQKTSNSLAQNPDRSSIPWFTGPLLSPTPINMLPGHLAIEPSVTIGSTYGKYDANWKLKGEPNEWFINQLVDFQMGFTKRLGLEVIASSISNSKKRRIIIKDARYYFTLRISNC